MLLGDIAVYAEGLRTSNLSSVDYVIAAPLLYILPLRELTNNTITLCAQDVSAHVSGAYTGEIAAKQLHDMHVDMTLVGHSERRIYHAETNTLCAEKILRAVEAGITPIYCVGERAEDRDAGTAEEVVTQQIEEGLAQLSDDQRNKIVIAYEPVWAIGTGRTATTQDILLMHDHIRRAVGNNVHILYGGSVNGNNAASILAIQHVDGVLVGGASLRIDECIKIIQSAQV